MERLLRWKKICPEKVLAIEAQNAKLNRV